MSIPDTTDRRSFFSRLAAGLGLGGAALVPGMAGAQGRPPYTPARHKEDDWLDTLGTKHRFVFDTTTTPAFSDALRFANNFLIANQTGYGLKDSDSGVVVVARHFSTVYAFSDAMWAKYGATLHAFGNPGAATAAPTANPFGNGNAVDVTVGTLVGRGAHFAVCGMATTFISTLVARAVNGDATTIRAELAANLVPNAHMAAAGILAVNRAQERGYTLATA
ncbi:MAG: hypothetical protein AB7P67_12225 [Vicinamibacterales bacterium]